MTNQYPLARPLKPIAKKSEIHYPHNHLQSLLDGFVDFSGVENCTLTFKGLSINSKKVHEEFLFLACGGVGNIPQHGIAYAGEAINFGATCVAWEPTDEVNSMPASCPVLRDHETVDVPLIQVEALHENIGEIAARFYQHPSRSLNVMGITGTNGKTSTAHFIAQLIHAMEDAAGAVKECAVIGTLGNGLYGQLEQSSHTTPDAVTLQELMAKYRDEQADTLVMEVSSHALSQGRVNGVEFDCAILTNLTRDHLDYHGDMQAYADEKLKLFHFSSLQQIILNKDDLFAEKIMASINTDISETSVVCYSRKDSSADYYADNIHLSRDGISFTLHVTEELFQKKKVQKKKVQKKKVQKKKAYPIKTHLVGDFNIENLLAAIAALHVQGYALSKIVSAVKRLTVVPGRMEKIVFKKNAVTSERPLIVVDYAHTPDALEKGLSALKAHTKGKLICLFGCGGDRDKGKRPLMAKIAQQQADQIVVTSDNPRTESATQIIEDIICGFSRLDSDHSRADFKKPDFTKKLVIAIDREKAIHETLKSMNSDDVVLIAGKGHEDYQEINGQRIPFSDKDSVISFYMNKAKRQEDNCK